MNKEIDIAFWPHTTNPKIASFRLRVHNIIKNLQNQHMQVGYFTQTTIPKILILSKRYDKQTLKKAIEIKTRYGTKLVLDLCDNHFYNEKNDSQWEKKIGELTHAIHNVDLIIASTDTLKTEIQKHLKNPVQITVIGDVVEKNNDINNFANLSYWKHLFSFASLKKKLDQANQKPYRLVWFGNHGSPYASGGMEDLLLTINALKNIAKKHPITLTVVSNNRNKFDTLFHHSTFPAFYIEWNPYFFSRILNLHTISLIPITPNPFTDAKTNNRIATSLIHNLGVCASCIPSYKEVMECITSEYQWEDCIYSLFDEPTRLHTINSITSNIASKYSDKIIYNLWKETLAQLLKAEE